MPIRTNSIFSPYLEEYANSEDAKIVYSMWNGYLDKEKSAFNPTLFEFLEPYEFEYKHTSGHADIETLKAVFEAVNPKGGIIPIHTENPEKFEELFSEQDIILLRDGERFICS
jgi:ribonuclease J